MAREVNRLKTEDAAAANAMAAHLRKLAAVLGLLEQEPEAFLQSGAQVDDAEVAEIESLIQQRLDARKAKDWAAADAARDRLNEMGIVLEDGPQGTTAPEVSHKNARFTGVLFSLSGRDGHALAFKAHRLTSDDFAAFAGFHRAVDFTSPSAMAIFARAPLSLQPSSFSRSHSSTCGCLPKENVAISGLLNVVILFARLQRVLDQGGDGHRANAAGNRGDVGRAFGGIFIHHVADHFAAFQTVDADIDHNRPFFNPLAGNKARFAHRDDQQVGVFDMMAQVFVKRWVTVVVQPASSSSMLIGRPTILEAPMTTALRP